ncbi:hypothetical protein EYF80_036704 [Liparis tanakae]|uniref:Uncharacterized protein n=1 Tax=Liparis tanakae TaxID=230148 RepID=A0A4Z2GI55_9TELE|nr:hypothetical protein EYF80_036704 [Liparis tanakae]
MHARHTEHVCVTLFTATFSQPEQVEAQCLTAAGDRTCNILWRGVDWRLNESEGERNKRNDSSLLRSEVRPILTHPESDSSLEFNNDIKNERKGVSAPRLGSRQHRYTGRGLARLKVEPENGLLYGPGSGYICNLSHNREIFSVPSNFQGKCEVLSTEVLLYLSDTPAASYRQFSPWGVPGVVPNSISTHQAQ